MRRIFIISHHPLFGHGLQSLLNKQRNIEIVGQATTVDPVSDEITLLQPDVIIFDDDEPAQISTLILLYQILKEHAGIKIVGLSLQNNRFWVYEATHGVAYDVTDLLEVIF